MATLPVPKAMPLAGPASAPCSSLQRTPRDSRLSAGWRCLASLMPHEQPHPPKLRSSTFPLALGSLNSYLGYTIQGCDLGEQSSHKPKTYLNVLKLFVQFDVGLTYLWTVSWKEGLWSLWYSQMGSTSKKLRIVLVEFYRYICMTLQRLPLWRQMHRWSSFHLELGTIRSIPTAQDKAWALPKIRMVSLAPCLPFSLLSSHNKTAINISIVLYGLWSTSKYIL